MNSKNRPLSSLDVFLLTLIDSGVSTSYAMREQAGISVGASRPAMRRLKELGLVTESEAQSRGKVAFNLTRSGRRAKSAGLERLLAEYRVTPPSDTESILRVVAMAISEARSSEAKKLLEKAADEFRCRAGESGKLAKDAESGVASIYQNMVAAVSSTQLAAMSERLADLATLCRKLALRPRSKHALQQIKK